MRLAQRGVDTRLTLPINQGLGHRVVGLIKCSLLRYGYGLSLDIHVLGAWLSGGSPGKDGGK